MRRSLALIWLIAHHTRSNLPSYKIRSRDLHRAVHDATVCCTPVGTASQRYGALVCLQARHPAPHTRTRTMSMRPRVANHASRSSAEQHAPSARHDAWHASQYSRSSASARDALIRIHAQRAPRKVGARPLARERVLRRLCPTFFHSTLGLPAVTVVGHCRV